MRGVTMKHRLRAAAAAALLVAGLAVVGCGGSDETTTTVEAAETGTEAQESEETGSETTVPAGGGQELTIKMGEFYYEPSDVTAKAGTVTITAPNEGNAPHELVIAKTNDDPAKLPTVEDGSVDEASLDIPGEVEEVEAGATGTATLELSADKYVMFCNLPGHYEGGMYGSLTVE
jgi:uncharacterized cupredoxin-like copper-binding protein